VSAPNFASVGGGDALWAYILLVGFWRADGGKKGSFWGIFKLGKLCDLSWSYWMLRTAIS